MLLCIEFTLSPLCGFPLCEDTTIYLSMKLLKGIRVISGFWILWIKLLWIFFYGVHIHAFQRGYLFLVIECLVLRECICLPIVDILQSIFKILVSIYIPWAVSKSSDCLTSSSILDIVCLFNCISWVCHLAMYFI